MKNKNNAASFFGLQNRLWNEIRFRRRITAASPYWVALLAAALILAVASSAVIAQEQTTRPNILFILLDDVGLNVMESFVSNGAVTRLSSDAGLSDILQIEETPGGRYINLIKTPNIDRHIVERGVRFSNMSVNPWCAPTRAMIQTGRYRHRNGAGNYNLAVDEQTIGSLLKENGYQTAYIGKWHVGDGGKQTSTPALIPSRHGYDYFANEETAAQNLLENNHGSYKWTKVGYSDCEDPGNCEALQPVTYDARQALCVAEQAGLITTVTINRSNENGFSSVDRCTGEVNTEVLVQEEVIHDFDSEEAQTILRQNHKVDQLLEDAKNWRQQAAAKPAPWFMFLALNHPHGKINVPPNDCVQGSCTLPYYHRNLCGEPLIRSGVNGLNISASDPDITLRKCIAPSNYSGEEFDDTNGERFRAIVEYLDTRIGDFLDSIANDQSHPEDYDNTLIFFLGDNGTSAPKKVAAEVSTIMEARNLFPVSSSLRGDKRLAYEGGVAVPFAVAGANVMASRMGVTDSALVNGTDLFATAVAAAGGIVPDDTQVDSVDITPVVNGTARRARNYSFVEGALDSACENNSSAIRSVRFKLLRDEYSFSDNPQAESCVDQFFDLENDPTESSNLLALDFSVWDPAAIDGYTKLYCERANIYSLDESDRLEAVCDEDIDDDGVANVIELVEGYDFMDAGSTPPVQTLYASPGVLDGAGLGTEPNPFSFDDAMRAANPGDTIQLAAGDYAVSTVALKSVRILGAPGMTSTLLKLKRPSSESEKVVWGEIRGVRIDVASAPLGRLVWRYVDNYSMLGNEITIGQMIALSMVSNFTIKNNVIRSANHAAGYGVRVTEASSNTVIENNTLTGFAAGVVINEGAEGYLIQNNIFYNNTESITGLPNDLADRVQYNLYDVGPVWGSGSVLGVPGFIDAAAGDYRLQPGSLGVDGGNPHSNFDNEYFPVNTALSNGGRINMGAYGNTQIAAGSIDSDYDGVSDVEELEAGTDSAGGTVLLDFDVDGMPDDWESIRGTNPLVPDADRDTDGDGVANVIEYIYGTEPIDKTSFPSVQTLYASPGVPDGAGLGTEPNPFSFDDAMRAANPGDTIQLAAGDYAVSTVALKSVRIRGAPDMTSTLLKLKRPSSESEKVVWGEIHGVRIDMAQGRLVWRYVDNYSMLENEITIGQMIALSMVSNFTIKNNVIRSANDAAGYGVRVTEASNNTVIENNTLTGFAAGVVINEGAEGYLIQNNIFYNNTESITGLPNDLADRVQYNLYDVGPVWGSGSVLGAPGFIDAAAGDYRLQPGSLGVDGGNPLSDYSVEPDYPAGQINMGAFGNTLDAALN